MYVGITMDLPIRMRQHGVTRPIYQEGPVLKAEALKRERSLKGWTFSNKCKPKGKKTYVGVRLIGRNAAERETITYILSDQDNSLKFQEN